MASNLNSFRLLRAWARRFQLLMVALPVLLMTALLAQNSPAAPVADVEQIAQKAYTFAYPLVVMEMTRRAATLAGGPNHFAHAQVFPDERFRQVIRPNADTLYSTAWLDLANEPVLLHVPDTRDRYYLFQVMDAWTETIASPGKRTTGTGEGWFAIAGPGWNGTLPAGVKRIDCPTNTAWLLGRTQTNNPSDYEFVHSIQKGYKLLPLSSYPHETPEVAYDPSRPAGSTNVAPPAQVAKMSAKEFFELFAQLLKSNPPHTEDAPIVAELARIGIVPGRPFPANPLSDTDLKAIDQGAQAAAAALAGFDGSKLAKGKTGWTLPGSYGRYGMRYPFRAIVARYFLGALPAEDAVYLSALRDPAGQAFSGSQRYTMHFDKAAIPPVRAFWSLTLYDDQGYFAANPIKRFAIGDRDAVKFNPDGSLDLYIQHDSPGAGKENNWLPAPTGGFNLVLRMYWPDEQVVKGSWIPPAVVPVAAPNTGR